MGILGFFGKNNKATPTPTSNNRYSDFNKSDLSLSYKSGVKTEISFLGVEQIQLDDGTIKKLEGVKINNDMPDGKFENKKYYMEPIYDKDGNDITKDSYIKLLNENKPLVKGFFQIDELKNQSTNYIGYISYNRQGKPIRAKDRRFEEKYIEKLTKDIRIKEQADKNNFYKKINDLVKRIDEKGPIEEEKNPEWLLNKEDYKKYARTSQDNCRY